MTIYQFQDGVWAVYQWIYKAIHRVILIIFWLVEFLLFLRLLLIFFRANGGALVADQLYWLTGKMVQPFQSIFPNYDWLGYPIELTAVSAMAGYMIVAVILLLLLRLFKHERTTYSAPPIQYH